MPNPKHLGSLLVEAGIITERQLEEALQAQKHAEKREYLGETLKRLGYVDDQQIMMALEFQLGIPSIDLNRVLIPPDLTVKLPVTLARKHSMVPVKIENDVLYVAIQDVFDIVALNDARLVSGMEVRPLLAQRSAILHRINDLYGNETAERALEEFRQVNLQQAVQLVEDTQTDAGIGSAPMIRLINSVLEQALQEGASDIHIEPQDHEVRIRLRVDGSLYSAITAPRSAHAAMISRIKIMGQMDIAEKRLPQDGRCEITLLGRRVDLRISTLPTVHGEKAVLRLLDRSTFLMDKSKLGLNQRNLELFDTLLKNPHGILLITGPTGSGKTTTLYTMLGELNRPQENIITVEDPVEYLLPGISQVQVNPKAGLDFASGLRSILRQDPDIIMVGEIRDQETVSIATRAAITGHLVLSTIHTNDSVSTISRLVDMGVPSYMLAAALVGIIAQRLVRTICPQCKASYTPSPQQLAAAGIAERADDTVFYHGTGCAACNQTGYRGRMAVYEILPITRMHREMIQKGASVDQIRDLSVYEGLSTLKNECLQLVLQGKTTLDELIKVAYSQEDAG